MPAHRTHSSARTHVAALTAARLVGASLGAITALLVPRLLSVDSYGQYGLVVGIAVLLSGFADLGMTLSTARYLAEERVERRLVIRVLAIRTSVSAALATLLVGAGAAIGSGRLDGTGSSRIEPTYLYLAAALVLAMAAFEVATGLLPTLRELRIHAAMLVAQPLVEVVGVVTVMVLALGESMALLATVVAYLVVGVAGFVAMRRIVPVSAPRGDAVDVRTIATYGRAVFVVTVCIAVFMVVDQAVIWVFHGNSATAAYTVSWRIVALLCLPGTIAGMVLAPRIAGAGAAGRAMFRSWLRRLAIAYVGVAVLAAASSPLVVPFVLGAKYEHAVGVLASLAVFVVLSGIAPLTTLAANFVGGAGRRVRPSLALIACNAGLDLALVPVWGAYGAVVATTITFGAYVAGHVRMVDRLLALRADAPAPTLALLDGGAGPALDRRPAADEDEYLRDAA